MFEMVYLFKYIYSNILQLDQFSCIGFKVSSLILSLYWSTKFFVWAEGTTSILYPYEFTLILVKHLSLVFIF